MPIRTLALATLASILAFPAAAHSPHFCGGATPHPNDAQLDRAADASGGTTYDMREAQSAAYEAWDRELNRIYKLLLEGLDEDAGSTLREAQRAWIAWDKAEGAWSGQPAVYGDGTAALLMIGGDAVSRRRERVCALQGYLEGVRENNAKP